MTQKKLNQIQKETERTDSDLEWEVVEVKEVCEKIVDCINNTAPTVEGPTPYKMIRTPNIEDGHLDLEDTKYSTEETYEKWTRRAEVKKGDVLLTREAPLGDVALVRREDTIFLGQRIVQYRPDTDVLDPRFLTYAFMSPFVQKQIHKFKGSGSVVDHIRVPECEELKIPLPPLEYQKKVSDILDNLDEKIHVNRGMNPKLESFGRCLYRKWFEEYEPYEDFKETEKGKIPKSFEVKDLVEIADVTYGKSFDSSNYNDDGEGFPLIRNGDLPENETDKFTTEDFGNEYLIEPGDLLVSMDGKFRSYIWKGKKSALNQRVCKFEGKGEKFSNIFLYFLLEKPLSVLEKTKTGTTVIHLGKRDIRSTKVVVPDEESLNEFNKILNPIYEKMVSNVVESRNLESVRDRLIPKMLSGEMKVETDGDE